MDDKGEMSEKNRNLPIEWHHTLLTKANKHISWGSNKICLEGTYNVLSNIYVCLYLCLPHLTLQHNTT